MIVDWIFFHSFRVRSRIASSKRKNGDARHNIYKQFVSAFKLLLSVFKNKIVKMILWYQLQLLFACLPVSIIYRVRFVVVVVFVVQLASISFRLCELLRTMKRCDKFFEKLLWMNGGAHKRKKTSSFFCCAKQADIYSKMRWKSRWNIYRFLPIFTRWENVRAIFSRTATTKRRKGNKKRKKTQRVRFIPFFDIKLHARAVHLSTNSDTFLILIIFKTIYNDFN